MRALEDADQLVQIQIDGAWIGIRQDSDILARYDAACVAHKTQLDARRSHGDAGDECNMVYRPIMTT